MEEGGVAERVLDKGGKREGKGTGQWHECAAACAGAAPQGRLDMRALWLPPSGHSKGCCWCPRRKQGWPAHAASPCGQPMWPARVARPCCQPVLPAYLASTHLPILYVASSALILLPCYQPLWPAPLGGQPSPHLHVLHVHPPAYTPYRRMRKEPTCTYSMYLSCRAITPRMKLFSGEEPPASLAALPAGARHEAFLRTLSFRAL